MWTKSHSIVAKDVTKEQIWHLFSDVNNWHTWDDSIEFARMEGRFEAGNHFLLRPKGGPNVKIAIQVAAPHHRFTDLTKFPLAKMTGDHLFEETPDGLRITNTITVTGLLGFLWVKLVAKKIADAMPEEMLIQAQTASRL